MKYCIVYLIRGKPGSYQKKLINSLSSKFKIRNLSYHVPPHVTLKEPFEVKDVRKIELFLDLFCKNEKASNLSIDGFGNFNKHVVFLNVEFFKGALKTYKNFVKKLRSFKEISFGKYDGLGTFHATVGYARDKKQFEEIYNFLIDKHPKYNLIFDNISILKKVRGNWKVHKIFKISG